MKIFKKITLLVIQFLFILGAFFSETSTPVSLKRILFISSFSYSWFNVQEQIKGLEDALSADYINLEYKFMDSNIISSPEQKENFTSEMEFYLSHVKPFDAVILGDDPAFRFGVEHKDDFFKNTSLIFLGVNDVAAAIDVSKDYKITGIIESISYKGTIDAALKIFPKARRVIAIIDNNSEDDLRKKAYNSMVADYPDLKFQELNPKNYSPEAFLSLISALDTNSILLYVSGHYVVSDYDYEVKKLMETISENASVPVFSIEPYLMGHGILGGEIVDQERMGFRAGDIAEQIVLGTSQKLFSVQSNTPRKFIFDEGQMKRFGIHFQDIPAQSDIINHTYTWGEKHQLMVRNLFIILAAVGVLIMIPLFIENRRKDKKNLSISKLNEMLDHSTKYDHLTNLLNRSIFDANLNNLMEEKKPFTIIMFDLDNFKNINDTYGHNQGDAVLCELARRSQSLCDSFFTMYRLAGDEFTAIISDIDKAHVESYVREIQNRMNEPYDIGDTFLNLHASIGIAQWPGDGENKTSLVAAADKAMYHVKNNGKGGFCWYEDIKDLNSSS